MNEPWVDSLEARLRFGSARLGLVLLALRAGRAGLLGRTGGWHAAENEEAGALLPQGKPHYILPPLPTVCPQ